jgi:hypothetical protein
MEQMDRLGDLYRDQGLVFATNSGAPLNPSNIRNRNLRRLTKAAGLPDTRFHDLRPLLWNESDQELGEATKRATEPLV